MVNHNIIIDRKCLNPLDMASFLCRTRHSNNCLTTVRSHWHNVFRCPYDDIRYMQHVADKR